MAGNILTPVSIWKDFKVEQNPVSELISESKIGEVIISRIYIQGPKSAKGRIKIYGVMARKAQTQLTPAVLVLPDLKHGIDEDYLISLAKEGYIALAIDFTGKQLEGYYTVYPEDKEYADYSNAQFVLDRVPHSAKETCWYVWGSMAKTALEYLINQPYVLNVGAIGINLAGSILWHVSANEKRLSCVVFVLNSGWQAYKDQLKYSTATESDFSDEQLRYVAGIEPQAYAPYVKCPTLMLCATNNTNYDSDRAYDTLARIQNKKYNALNFSVAYANGIDFDSNIDTTIFLDKFLHEKTDESVLLPKEPELVCGLKDGTLSVKIQLDDKGLEEITLYCAEETLNPALRSWRKVFHQDKQLSNEVEVSYMPYKDSERVFFVAKAKYKNGFTISSNVLCKRFLPSEAGDDRKENIMYSGRNNGKDLVFTPVYTDGYIETQKGQGVKQQIGPMEIVGAGSEVAITSFKMNSKISKPNEDSLLMLDIYSEKDSTLTITLISDYLKTPIEYFVTVQVVGGKIWNNVKLSKNKFKTKDGFLLKSYDKVNAIKFACSNKFVINNVLWV